MDPGYPVMISRSVSILDIVILIDTAVNIQQNISIPILLCKLMHDCCQVILPIQMLLTANHAINSLNVEQLCRIRCIGVNLVFCGHALFLVFVVFQDPPLVIEKHGRRISITFLYRYIMS